MPRRKRSYLPGGVFHIYARTHRKEKWFDEELRDVIVSIIAHALPRSDADLMAWSIMPNHYHLVIQQGIAPIAQLIQPVNREIALAVHRKQRRKGHVFERRFFAKPCMNADQLREWIVYTHRNARRAKLCNEVGDWRWSSHQFFLGAVPKSGQPRLQIPLELFADSADGLDGRAGYVRYLEWRAACDALSDGEIKPLRPPTFFGDAHYSRCFKPAESAQQPVPERDLRDVIIRKLKEIDPQVSVEHLRLGIRTRPMVATRGTVIVEAIQAGHRVADIARFLNMSDTAVSRVATTVRPRPPVRFDNR